MEMQGFEPSNAEYFLSLIKLEAKASVHLRNLHSKRRPMATTWYALLVIESVPTTDGLKLSSDSSERAAGRGPFF